MSSKVEPTFSESKFRLKVLAFFLTFALCAIARPAFGQQQTQPPDTALSEALSAACRQDSNTFANFLTADNAAAYRTLPEAQRKAFMKRFVLLEDAGRPLLSSGSNGRPVIRCEAPGISAEMRFGDARIRDNLAFVPVRIPIPGSAERTVTLGLVRETNTWKLLSVGLVLLDIPLMANQWETADLEAREDKAIAGLRTVATALDTYRRAYGKLPEALTLLGPASAGNISPETAGLIDQSLSAGVVDGYTIRYRIIPAGDPSTDQEADLAASFELGATPTDYGKSGKRSFFLDGSGILRGADKQGAVANKADERVGPT